MEASACLGLVVGALLDAVLDIVARVGKFVGLERITTLAQMKGEASLVGLARPEDRGGSLGDEIPEMG